MMHNRHWMHRGSQGGFLLMEVLLMAVVMAVGLISILGAFHQGLQADRQNALLTAAVNSAQATIEQMKAVPPEQLQNFAGSEDFPGPNGERFQRRIFISPSESDSSLLNIEVVVFWTEQQRPFEVRLHTQFLLAPFSNYALHPEAG